jgi:hypothetical protein
MIHAIMIPSLVVTAMNDLQVSVPCKPGMDSGHFLNVLPWPSPLPPTLQEHSIALTMHYVPRAMYYGCKVPEMGGGGEA